MVKFYVRKIKDGTITIDKVPERWREAVESELISQGYIINEDGSVSHE